MIFKSKMNVGNVSTMKCIFQNLIRIVSCLICLVIFDHDFFVIEILYVAPETMVQRRFSSDRSCGQILLQYSVN